VIYCKIYLPEGAKTKRPFMRELSLVLCALVSTGITAAGNVTPLCPDFTLARRPKDSRLYARSQGINPGIYGKAAVGHSLIPAAVNSVRAGRARAAIIAASENCRLTAAGIAGG